jgi:ABC-2 type transport system permease protein
MLHELNTILTIGARDVTKYVRDKSRVVSSFVFPVLFIGVLGGGLQQTVGEQSQFNFLAFIFTGILAQNLFQSTASGVIFLIEDRANDFAQEMFVAPVSRYSILVGKIFGESLVAIIHGVGIVVFGLILGVPLSLSQMLLLIPVAFAACFLGGAFGILILANFSNYRAASQIFPFIIFPQFILAGVFVPITGLPGIFGLLSRLAPMTYAVDLLRSVYYVGSPDYEHVVVFNAAIDLAIGAVLFSAFLFIGAFLFVRKEKNK